MNGDETDAASKETQCAQVAGKRRLPHKPLPRRIVIKKRKKLVVGVKGKKTFVLVAKETQIPRNDSKIFPNTDSGEST